jgi:hypothetical protein
MTKYKPHIHGDFDFIPTKYKAPKDAKYGTFFLGTSSVTGNSHIMNNAFEFSKDGKRLIAFTKGGFIDHKQHGKQDMDAIVYELKNQMEHDPWRNELRVVVD